MVQAALPERLKLDRVSPAETTVSGSMPLSALPRLSALLVSKAGQLEATLHLTPADGGRVVIDGRVEAAVSIRCERCLEPFTLPMQADIAVVAVRSESEAAQLGHEDEPVVAPGGELDLRAMLEDELLLALPIVARHEFDCDPRDRHFGPPGEQAPEKENPFADLSRLKRGRGDN